MPDDPSCQAPRAPAGAVPRTCVPFAHVPAVPVMAVPYVPVPVPSGLPVLSVSGILPDRTGNVDVSQFLSSWAGEFAAAKADKASPAVAGNLASLDASGNLADSGATPASIKAAAVAEVVANAPGTMDTLKEIADILGSVQQSGTVLKRILDLEAGKAEKSEMSVTAGSDATKKTIQLKSGLSQEVLVAHQDVSGKAEKSELSVTPGSDATKKVVQLKSGLAQTVLVEHQDVSGKMDGEKAYPAWSAASYAEGQIVWHAGKAWVALNGAVPADVPGDGSTWLEYDGTLYAQIRAKQDALSQPQLAAVEKAGKAVLTLSISSAEGHVGDGQSVVVGGRTFSNSAWANRPPVVLAGVGRAEIHYGGYPVDCSVRLNGADVGKPESVVLDADSLLEVSFADCLHPDTPVLMADGTRKRVADVRAGDRVATPFGPDEVTRTSAGHGARMDEWQFSDGTTIRTVGRHRFWNADLGEFMYLEAWNVGERAVRADGTVAELVSRRTSEGDFPHATLFTARWNVYYAGGLVAGNRKSARPWR